MSFQFSLIRFVPDAARGEFVNIGAVAGSDDTGEWELRLVSNLRRAKSLDDRGRLPQALAFAAGLEDHISGELQLVEPVAPMSKEFLRQSATDLQNLVQLTPPAPVAADSPEQALELIFDQLIQDAGRRSFPFEKKHRAVAAARHAYRSHDEFRGAVKERAEVRSGAFDATFDFAVHNGRAIHLVQCWSFQLPNQTDLAEQVKAWSWVVHELRDKGGNLELGGTALEIPRDLAIFSVMVPPERHIEAPAYEEARAAFDENDVTALVPNQAGRLVEQAIEALSGS